MIYCICLLLPSIETFYTPSCDVDAGRFDVRADSFDTRPDVSTSGRSPVLSDTENLQGWREGYETSDCVNAMRGVSSLDTDYCFLFIDLRSHGMGRSVSS